MFSKYCKRGLADVMCELLLVCYYYLYLHGSLYIHFIFNCPQHTQKVKIGRLSNWENLANKLLAKFLFNPIYTFIFSNPSLNFPNFATCSSSLGIACKSSSVL